MNGGFIVLFLIIFIGLGAFQYIIAPTVKEGLETADKQDSALKKNIEFLNYLIVHSDPTPDNSGDYTSDVGVDMITNFLKTLPTKQRLHPKLGPYLDLLQFTTETAENDVTITNLKKLIVDLAEKEESKLESKKLAEAAKVSTSDMDDLDEEE
jgi:hypothetical protein